MLICDDTIQEQLPFYRKRNYRELFCDIQNDNSIDYNFHRMSVLEEEEFNFKELHQCKWAYLQQENAWMREEYQFLCQLIQDHKQLIEANFTNNHLQSQTITQRIQQLLQQRIAEYQQIKESSQKINDDICIEEFLPLACSFEDKIQELQQSIKNRQIQLQQFEDSKDRNLMEDRRSDFKCLSSYDVHSRILDKLKRETLVLKLKKKRLQNNLAAIKDGNEDQSTVYSSQVQKSNSPVLQENTLNISNQDQMSTFEKVVLLLKKKKFQNDSLEEKISKLKKGVQHKKIANSKLTKEIQNLEWKCIQNLEGAKGFVEGGENELSIMGKSFNFNNNSFSIDVSRFIRLSK